jgi:hypothetical protein
MLFDDYQLEFVDKDISPWGGVSLLFKMLSKSKFEEALVSFGMPAQGSNRGYSPIQLIEGMFAGVWCGAGCFDHLDIVRYDKTFGQLLGWKRNADHRAYQRYLNKFTQAINTRCFDAMYGWFFDNLRFDNYTLDFDSTVMDRSGEQEGSAKGYNPRRPGRKSVHPLLAFVADIRMIANYWLRPGNTGATTNFLSFLESTLGRLQHKKVGLIRADSGFYSKEIFDYLEDRTFSYIIACRFTRRFKYALVHQRIWAEIADGIEIAETTYQAEGWKAPRRIVMVRQQIEKRPKAAGKKIKQLELFTDDDRLGNYRYSCYITNLTLPGRVVYEAYRGRADSENRIKELKHDFSIDKFTLHNFWASEACGNFIVMAYNFMSLFRHVLINSTHKPFLKTIRYKLFAVAGYITQTADRKTLHLAKGLRNRDSLLGIWKSLDDFLLPYEYP